MPPLTGTLLSHRYEIRESIGQDGIVQVYRALDLRLGRDVSLTVLEVHNLAGTEEYLRFERESQARAAMQHPRITTIHDFGHDASRIFLVAEWMEGESLRARLGKGFLDWPEVRALGRDLLEGVEAIHEKGYALGSLDAASVFLEKEGRAKLFAYRLKKAGNGEPETAHFQMDLRALAVLLRGALPPRRPRMSRTDAQLLDRLHDWAECDEPQVPLDIANMRDLLQERPSKPWKRRILWSLVPLLLLSGSGFLAWRNHSVRKTQTIIALLPFQHLGGEGAFDAMGPDLLQSLAGELVRNPKFRVVLPGDGRTVIEDPVATARKMQADLVLVGSYQIQKGHLTVNTQIFKTQDGSTLSRCRVERPLTEILSLATELEDRLQASLQDNHWLDSSPESYPSDSKNPEARRLYLQGLQLLSGFSEEDLPKASACFQSAVSLDSSFALAHSGLADTYIRMGCQGMMPPRKARQLAETSTRKALLLDPGLAQAHASLAAIQFLYDRDWKGAEQELRQALLLNPNCAGSHQLFAVLQSTLGHWESSLEHMRRAVELEPLSLACRTHYAMNLHWAGRSQEAVQEFQKILDQVPKNAHALILLWRLREDLGQIEEALSIAKRLAELGIMTEKDAEALRNAYIAQGNKGYWAERVRQAERQKEMSPLLLAESVTLMGDKDRAFRLLRRALQEQSPLLTYVPKNPAFESLRQDPRFMQLLREMGYPAS
jgi:tetratricopeptide (TPR) repeat protein